MRQLIEFDTRGLEPFDAGAQARNLVEQDPRITAFERYIMHSYNPTADGLIMEYRPEVEMNIDERPGLRRPQSVFTTPGLIGASAGTKKWPVR